VLTLKEDFGSMQTLDYMFEIDIQGYKNLKAKEGVLLKKQQVNFINIEIYQN
jgi:hypothetical protein